MKVGTSVFTEFRFFLLIAFSIVVPIAIYGFLILKRSISRWAVLLFGIFLIGIAGLDVYLLQSLTALAKITASFADDSVFTSELSLALYLLPAMIGGIGTNIISHILVSHLTEAEKRFDRKNK